MQKKSPRNTTPQSVQNEYSEVVKVASKEPYSFPLNYTYLVICLSTLFGSESDVEIANFWKKYRPILKDIFSDFPNCDISADAVRKLLELTSDGSAWDNLDNILEPISNGIRFGTIENVGESTTLLSLNDTDEIFVGVNFFELSFFPTAKGIAIGLKRNSGDEKSIGSPTLFGFDIDGTVVTFNGDDMSSMAANRLLKDGAGYFLQITGKQEILLKAIQKTFNNSLNETEAIQVSRKGELQKDAGLKRTITILPAKLLKKTYLTQWNGLADGSLIKEIICEPRKSSGNISVQEVFYISSYSPDNPHIAEQVVRAIWEKPKVPDSFLYLFNIDFFQDISQSKESHYVANIKDFKDIGNRLQKYLKGKNKKDFKAVIKKRDVDLTKEVFIQLILLMAFGYIQVLEEEKEEEKRYWASELGF